MQKRRPQCWRTGDGKRAVNCDRSTALSFYNRIGGISSAMQEMSKRHGFRYAFLPMVWGKAGCGRP